MPIVRHVRIVRCRFDGLGAGGVRVGDIEGSSFVGNHVHDVVSYDMTGGGSSGLYTDEGCHRGYFASNVIWRINTEGINQHYGTEDVFDGNVEKPIGEFVLPSPDGVGVFGDAGWVAEAKSIVPAKMVDQPMPAE